MSELHSDAASAAAGIDLSQFYQVFFEEAGENLDNLEQMLLHVDLESAEDEDLNAIFRCAHSIKGGAATFGFKDIAERHGDRASASRTSHMLDRPAPRRAGLSRAAGDPAPIGNSSRAHIFCAHHAGACARPVGAQATGTDGGTLA